MLKSNKIYNECDKNTHRLKKCNGKAHHWIQVHYHKPTAPVPQTYNTDQVTIEELPPFDITSPRVTSIVREMNNKTPHTMWI